MLGSASSPKAISKTLNNLQLGFQLSGLKMPKHIDPFSSLLTFG